MSKTQLVGGITCPSDEEMNETILGMLGWKRSENEADDFGGAGRGWHRPNPDRPAGVYTRVIRECDRPNFMTRQTGPWHVRDWAQELLTTDIRKDVFMGHLWKVVGARNAEGGGYNDKWWVMIMATPREWTVAILMTLRPDLFSDEDLGLGKVKMLGRQEEWPDTPQVDVSAGRLPLQPVMITAPPLHEDAVRAGEAGALLNDASKLFGPDFDKFMEKSSKDWVGTLLAASNTIVVVDPGSKQGTSVSHDPVETIADEQEQNRIK